MVDAEQQGPRLRRPLWRGREAPAPEEGTMGGRHPRYSSSTYSLLFPRSVPPRLVCLLFFAYSPRCFSRAHAPPDHLASRLRT